MYNGKVIDITSRISNEPKFVKIGEKSYKVDDRKNTVLEVMQLMDEGGTGVSTIDKALEKLVGKDAVKDFEEYSLADYQTVFIAVMACVQGVSYEECEKSFRRLGG